MSTPSPTGSGTSTAGAKNLQEGLHQLLTRLSSTIEIIKNWPESDGDATSVHVETTTKLISGILEVIVALQRAESVIKSDSTLRKSLQDCLVPINLLDLMDHGNGLNPGAYIFCVESRALYWLTIHLDDLIIKLLFPEFLNRLLFKRLAKGSSRSASWSQKT